MPESSRRPCIAPPSPSLPCRTGSTTCRLIVSYSPRSRTINPRTPGSGDSMTGRLLPFSQFSSGPSQSLQAPSFVIPIQNGSYFSVSRFLATSRADLTDTGCSSEDPPNIIPIFSLFMPIFPFEFQAVNNRVLNNVTQSVVCVVGRVRADKHVWELLEPQQQPVLDGPGPTVGVEYSFFSFEYVQRRTAQPAALQCQDKGLGINK